MNETILIIDDKIKLCKILAQDLENIGYRCYYAVNSSDALKIFLEHEFHVVILDLKLGTEDGLEVLQKLLHFRPGIPVIMVTGYATIESAVVAIKLGAFDYIQKPVNFTKLQRVVENALSLSRLKDENEHLKVRLLDSALPIVTRSGKMLEILNTLTKLAVTDYPIFLSGESGTGKELLADFIHMRSSRAAYKCHKLNCASLPTSLMDNELFGHKKGAYTGADSDFVGIFERADKSSLFLDEIGDMPLEIQAKILRTLQNHEIRRLGGKETRHVDVRFIAATNKDIKTLVEERAFREDLYYRLNVAMIEIPPLRERREDIPLLIHHFLSDFAKNNEQELKAVHNVVLEMLMNYSWPGNIRELKNVINYTVAVANGAVIGAEALPPHVFKEKVKLKKGNIRADMEKELILQVLQETKYNKKKAAERLNFSRRTLYNKMDKYGIST
ncbi:MAG: sigma-54-dependent Fis family transcriptional regulator [bacterium]|nr:sigma-54-dependent Fis family transcriptional regulator [bacterium]